MPPSPRVPLAAPPRHGPAVAEDYVELRSRSAFSFLRAASNPEDVAERAAALGYRAIGMADLDGVYGLPRFHKAALAAGVRPVLGAELVIEEPDAAAPGSEPASLTLLVETAAGWRRLCRLLTEGQRGRPKGECAVGWEQIEAHAEGLTALLRADARLTPERLARARAVFAPGGSDDRLWVDVSRHRVREEERRCRRAIAIAEAQRVPLVASGDVRCARAEERPLLDALTCLRWKLPLDRAGRKLLPNGERHLHSRETQVARFRDRPEWVRATRAVAERCAFTLEKLDYRFPLFPTPGDRDASEHLRQLTMEGARRRYGDPLPAKARRQLERELALIAKLDLCGYFLIVWDITREARVRGILCQGRGSAANSAVCYALGITAVDPVGMELLFERFLSEERGEWPDIDVDLPSGDQREEMIQYVYRRYGPHGAAMTANVITYKTRMAVREMGKVLGLGGDAVDRLAKLLGSLEHRDDLDELEDTLGEAGVDLRAPRIAQLLSLVSRVRGLPRHLGQHSGGLVIAAGRLDEVVPIEPASMENRHVVQWDKEDCADLGIIKIDLLGLGMLAALEDMIPRIREHEGVEIDLAHLPKDDPATYAMIRRADTIGTFQIESRAQMATLPRLKPRTFYDLVVEIAIIRPGPIVGQMVHPYLDRRAGREPVTYPHPSLEHVLARTLGVPLFQEQLLKIAMVAGGFSGGEAEELRRAMGFKRSMERMKTIEERLRQGMTRNGFTAQAQEDIVRHITSFALYGFPESHSASFALIAYASAYLKRHHPAAFLAGLLNAYPMGFYNPATLVKDAQRHGVTVRPIDVAHSMVRSGLEPGGPAQGPAVRIGLRYALGLREERAWAIVREREQRPYAGLADFAKRSALRRDELDTLAELGALASLDGAAGSADAAGGVSAADCTSTAEGANAGSRNAAGASSTQPLGRRAALWQVSALERDPSSMFAGLPPEREAQAHSPLPEMDAVDATLADYRLAGLTTGPQVMAHLRSALRARGVLSTREVRHSENGRYVRTAGHVIVRQRPGSAKGFTFLTLEDETGTTNAVLTPDQFRKLRAPLHASALLELEGMLQNVEGVVHVKVSRLRPLRTNGEAMPGTRSYR